MTRFGIRIRFFLVSLNRKVLSLLKLGIRRYNFIIKAIYSYPIATLKRFEIAWEQITSVWISCIMYMKRVQNVSLLLSFSFCYCVCLLCLNILYKRLRMVWSESSSLGIRTRVVLNKYNSSSVKISWCNVNIILVAL